MVLIRKKKVKTAEEVEQERQEKEFKKAGIQDEFQAKGFELVSWVQHHKTRISVILVVFALGLAVWGGVTIFRSGSSADAAKAYDAAINLVHDADAAKDDKAKKQAEAMKALDDVIQNQSGGFKKLAQLYKAKLASDMGNAKLAASTFEEFEGATSAKDPFRTVSLLGLASSYDSEADMNKALVTYETILSGDVKINEPMVLWQAARFAKALGDNEKLKKFDEKRKQFNVTAFAGPIPDVPVKLE